MTSKKKEFSYVFIHGFESTGEGNKPKAFRESLINTKSEEKCHVYLNSPTLWEKEEEFESTCFKDMFVKVSNAVKDASLHGHKVILMGSSFGGLLVTRLCKRSRKGTNLLPGVAYSPQHYILPMCLLTLNLARVSLVVWLLGLDQA